MKDYDRVGAMPDKLGEDWHLYLHSLSNVDLRSLRCVANRAKHAAIRSLMRIKKVNFDIILP